MRGMPAGNVPEILVQYTDPEEGFRGYLSIDGLTHRIAAGGFRVQPGLTAEHVARLARTMTLKQRLLGLRVDGAKSGIDYDPASPGKRDAIRRFLRAIRPYLLERYSMGPDLGTTMPEIEAVAREEGIPSVKVAVARAQGLDEREFMRRHALLKEGVGGMTLGARRAGHGVAIAALRVLTELGIEPGEARVGIQGFGTLGRAAALTLSEAGVRIVAIADAGGCLLGEAGVPIPDLLHRPIGTPILIRESLAGCTVDACEALFRTPLDILILAAVEDAMDERLAARLPARGVVVGANLAVPSAAEAVLHARGIPVVPDFVAGCAGSASMDALFGPDETPSAAGVLEAVGQRMDGIAAHVLGESRVRGIPPREAALLLCARGPTLPGARPYGSLKGSGNDAEV